MLARLVAARCTAARSSHSSGRFVQPHSAATVAVEDRAILHEGGVDAICGASTTRLVRMWSSGCQPLIRDHGNLTRPGIPAGSHPAPSRPPERTGPCIETDTRLRQRCPTPARTGQQGGSVCRLRARTPIKRHSGSGRSMPLTGDGQSRVAHPRGDVVGSSGPMHGPVQGRALTRRQTP